MLPNVAYRLHKTLNFHRDYHQSRKQADKQTDGMSDRGFTEIFIWGNWHHLTGTGNRRSKSWSQTAITRRTLQVYLPEAVTMRNLIQIFCPNLPVFNCSFVSAQFSCLLYIIYSSAPCMQRPLFTATSPCPTSFCVWLTQVHLISIIVINIAFLSEHPDQILIDKEATIKPETYNVDRSDRAYSAYIR